MPRISAEMANSRPRMNVDAALVPKANFDILAVCEELRVVYLEGITVGMGDGR